MDKIEIKALLIKEIERTKTLVGTYKENSKPIAPDNAIGRVSRMDAINNRSQALCLEVCLTEYR